MKSELEHALVTAYPELFAATELPPTESLMCFGCECGDGWYGLIKAASELISLHMKRVQQENPNAKFVWAQIKEKFGGLRLYYDGYSDDYIRGVLSMAYELAFITCEVCGSPGEQRSGGWIVTQCDNCYKK
jgi:hypothetical protein